MFQESDLLARIEEKLYVPEKLRRQLRHNETCGVCQTHVRRLKEEAVVMVQSLERTQTELGPVMAANAATSGGGGSNAGGGSCVVQLPRTTPHFSPAHHRYVLSFWQSL